MTSAVTSSPQPPPSASTPSLPVHGTPQDGAVTDPGYVPYVTADMVSRAHAAGMQVIPWTVDDKATMRALIAAGVDGLITDYPDRLRDVMAESGMKLPRS